MHIELYVGKGPACRQIIQSCGRCGFDALRVEAGETKLIGKEHGKAPAQCCRDQFVRVGSDAVRETRVKRISRVRKHATFGRHRAGSFAESSFPAD